MEAHDAETLHLKYRRSGELYCTVISDTVTLRILYTSRFSCTLRVERHLASHITLEYYVIFTRSIYTVQNLWLL